MTKTWEEIYAAFLEPFPADMVKWRIGATNNKENPTSGIPLAYIDARAVMDRLDAVVGPENWWDEYSETPTGRVICKLTIRRGEDFIPKSDGAGATDMEGDKGGLSDAFKRAAVKWGIGRYLYSLGTQWVPAVRRGKSVVVQGDPPKLPDWALPKANVAPMPTKLVLVPTKSEPPIKDSPPMSEVFENLYRDGIKAIGGEEFMKRVNIIIDNGYGGKDWRDLPVEEARKFYSDVVKAIKNGKEK